jgi:hypothetical protein
LLPGIWRIVPILSLFGDRRRLYAEGVGAALAGAFLHAGMAPDRVPRSTDVRAIA